MEVFRCQICGDTFVGFEAPTNCPFCGAHKNYMVLGRDWTDENEGVELSDSSRTNLEKALGIEVDNARFYYAAAAEANDIELQGMFKALAKVEAEHASIFTKVLKVPKREEAKTPSTCHETDLENIEESAERETRASKFYGDAAIEAREERVKDLFTVLAVVEKDHLDLDEMEKKRLTG